MEVRTDACSDCHLSESLSVQVVIRDTLRADPNRSLCYPDLRVPAYGHGAAGKNAQWLPAHGLSEWDGKAFNLALGAMLYRIRKWGNLTRSRRAALLTEVSLQN